jgi:RNA-directed DNA polymerase
MGKLLQAAISPGVLNNAWRRFHNDPGLWSPGVPVADVHRHLIRHIGELADQMADGSYRPYPMRGFKTPKADGGERTLCASFVRDRVAQRAVLTVIEPLGEAIFHDASFGYRPHCTVDMALARVRESVRRDWIWLVDADIEACFDTIPWQRAQKALFELCRDPELTALVGLWLRSMPPELRVHGAARGLPQGMVASPFLCNLYLHTLDQTLEREKIPFVRFADDFILLARTEREARSAAQVAGRCLEGLGLRLHPGKTQIIRTSSHHRFLGKRLPDPPANPILKSTARPASQPTALVRMASLVIKGLLNRSATP